MKTIRIKVTVQPEILFTCKFVWLEPFAPGTSRTFIFHGLKTSLKNSAVEKIRDGQLYRSQLQIHVEMYDKFKKWSTLYDFNLLVNDYGDLAEEQWWVSGLVYDDHFTEYRQGVIDVLSLWEKNQDINWLNLPVKSPLKKDYISCCLLFSGLSTQIVEREYYKIDMSLINEEEDFLYLIGLELVGEKGYCGHNFFTFEDCLLEFFHHGGFEKKRRIIFFNTANFSPEVHNLYQSVKSTFERFQFIVEENI